MKTLILVITRRTIPTGLCLLIGDIDASLIPRLVTFSTLFTQLGLIASIYIPALYLCIYHSMKGQSVTMQTFSHSSAMTERKGKGLNRMLISSLTNLFAWIPSSTVIIVTLTWPKYPYIILIWTTAIILPLNTIINQFVFMIRGRKTNETNGNNKNIKNENAWVLVSPLTSTVDRFINATVK